MRTLAAFFLLCLASVGVAACSSTGAPRSVQGQALVDQSKATLELFKSRAKDSTPLFRAGLRDAKGILIFPDVFQLAVGIGGMGGDGVMLTRQPDGTWGYPAFYSLGGGSVGIQLGSQSSEVIFLLMTERAVNAVISSPAKVSLGADAALGQISGSAGTTIGSGSDIVGFSKGEGVFAGVSFSGASISADDKMNDAYYRTQLSTPRDILIEHKFSNPGADGLRQALLVE